MVILTGVDRFDSSPEYISKSESEGVSVYVSVILRLMASTHASDADF